jgi:hypothetical protein
MVMGCSPSGKRFLIRKPDYTIPFGDVPRTALSTALLFPPEYLRVAVSLAAMAYLATPAELIFKGYKLSGARQFEKWPSLP